MLVLERKQGQSIIIGGFLKVVILEITEENEIQFGIRTTEDTVELTPKTDKEKNGQGS